MEVSLLTERRIHKPYGLSGGKPGKTGENILIKKTNKKVKLKSKLNIRINKGETLIIKTPGGGGYGKK